jgi:hypothetical protein
VDLSKYIIDMWPHIVPRQGNGEATAALQALVNRTVAEISSAPLAVASSEGPGGTERLRLDVIERRRILAEAGHTAGHLGVAALRAGDAVTAGRAAEILVSYLYAATHLNLVIIKIAMSLHCQSQHLLRIAQFPIEIHSEKGQFAETPLKIGKVQNLGDYDAIRSNLNRSK